MTFDSVAPIFATGPVVVGAKEPGAGALLAALIARLKQRPPIVALLEPQAWPYFEAIAIEKIQIEPHGAGWKPNPAEIIARVRPVQIVTGASGGWTVEKALIDIGRLQHIPVATFVDQYWNLWQRFAGARPRERWRYRPDTILLPDERAVCHIRRLGCPVRDLRRFVHPLITLPNSRVRSRECRHAARAYLGIGAEEFVILFVSEYTFENAEDWNWDQPADKDIEMLGPILAEICGTLRNEGHAVQLLVRPHPSEGRDWHRILSTDCGILVAEGINKDIILSAADLAVGFNSTLLAEAAVHQIPSYSAFIGSYSGLKLSDFRSDVTNLQSRHDLEAAIRRHIRGLR